MQVIQHVYDCSFATGYTQAVWSEMNDPWLAIVLGSLPTYANLRPLGTSRGSFCILPWMCNYVCYTIPYRLQLLKQGNHSCHL